MRFDIYGRFVLEVVRSNGRWQAFRLGEGKRRPASDLVIPAVISEAGLADYLADIYHELARPGHGVRTLRSGGSGFGR